jgi:hypothetical protein
VTANFVFWNMMFVLCLTAINKGPAELNVNHRWTRLLPESTWVIVGSGRMAEKKLLRCCLSSSWHKMSCDEQVFVFVLHSGQAQRSNSMCLMSWNWIKYEIIRCIELSL